MVMGSSKRLDNSTSAKFDFKLGSTTANTKLPKVAPSTIVSKKATPMKVHSGSTTPIQTTRFKATLLKPSMLRMGGVHGVPHRRDSSRLTRLVSPKLATKRLAEIRARKVASNNGKFDAQVCSKDLTKKRPCSVAKLQCPAVIKKCRLNADKCELPRAQSSVSNKTILTTTIPKPFNLRTEMRGERHATKWKQQIEKQEQKAKAKMNFKAKQVAKQQYHPFTIEKSTKPLTEVGKVTLHTDVRRVEREKYQADLKKRQEKALQEAEEETKLEALKELKDIAKLRKTLVHKAQPIGRGHHAPLVVKPSTKPLTIPKSLFSTSGH